MTPLTSLRIDLNKERASVREYHLRVARGAWVPAITTYKMEISRHRIPILKSTIKKLKNVKPVYQWEINNNLG